MKTLSSNLEELISYGEKPISQRGINKDVIDDTTITGFPHFRV